MFRRISLPIIAIGWFVGCASSVYSQFPVETVGDHEPKGVGVFKLSTLRVGEVAAIFPPMLCTLDDRLFADLAMRSASDELDETLEVMREPGGFLALTTPESRPLLARQSLISSMLRATGPCLEGVTDSDLVPVSSIDGAVSTELINNGQTVETLQNKLPTKSRTHPQTAR
ncbi:hypothetical protein [Pseudorhizobium flavum]|uniref:hypothetical protein n=1 Tax=Pseudorhizobium flavum TaxID=1335061 RepID=UPI00376FFD3E